MSKSLRTMEMVITEGKKFSRALLKDKRDVKAYTDNILILRRFHAVDQEYKLSVKEKSVQRLHGDSKSQFKYCIGISQERGPGGGDFFRVIGLYEGDKAVKEQLIMKAQFGGKIVGDPEQDTITDLQVRTAALKMLKEKGFAAVEEITYEQLEEPVDESKPKA
ncbi:hypothetical protein E4T56_gene14661 [Termitomyces sp. T112]|nr:hypothetical protein E4T56_gene14661 [Termitomyces sp. T112]